MASDHATTARQVSIADTSLTETEIDAAVTVLRSGALRQGRECSQFEAEFAQKVGGAHAVTSANGTTALHLAYLTFIELGDEVIVPSFTFIATASVVVHCGGRPVFCDVDPDTHLIDLAHAETLVTERTAAIAPVHLFGNPVDTDAVEQFARKHGLRIVWDAAQAHGARIHGADVGSFGDFVAYSFYPTKNMFVGEGGMTMIASAEAADRARLLRSHGAAGKYVHPLLGFNFRMTDVEAAIGRRQLERLDEMLAVRARNAAVLHRAVAEVDGISMQVTTEGGEHAYHQYCIVVDEARVGVGRDELAARLTRAGVGTGVHYPRGLHQQPAFAYLRPEPLPVTERLAESILALPVHHRMAPEDAGYVGEVLVSSARP